ncbi:MAG: alpha-hydroxy-acid oxidizing protein, partial [Ilumatobacter sp.]|nr:alpha-hydroxy-acid oxidizing protein [Ilumatobacter sp.]
AAHVMQQFDQRLSWDDIDWLRGIWDGPLMLKGIQTVADARRAADLGVEGIGLSNHGGRQLDDAPAPIELAEPVAQELQGAATVIVDGGVRRGSDIVKAIALGADGVSIGRPYLFGLGAAGERGVDHVLQFFREGLARTMALTGRTRISDIDRGLVRWRDAPNM